MRQRGMSVKCHRPQLGADAQAAVISFKPRSRRCGADADWLQGQPQQNWRRIRSGKGNVWSFRQVPGSEAFSRGATARSEDIGERIEHRPRRAGLKGIIDRLGNPSRLHESVFSKNCQMLGSRRLAQSHFIGEDGHRHFSLGQQMQDVESFGVPNGRQEGCFGVEGVGFRGRRG